MTQSFFPDIDLKASVAKSEETILETWKQQNIFQQTIDSRPKSKPFVFFDGPPFATGTPHYGHILAGTIKDVIPRYWTMKGYRVERKFGWDCHGVPVEFQVEKEQKIGGKPEIEKMGVGKFNEMCRSIVLRCREEWEDTVSRMGRFVDFKNDYKTMDPEFMESVWWVFRSLWDKGLIYEGEKVVAYSPKLGSPLSNFEANLNYQSIDDPAVTVKFRVKEFGPNTPHPGPLSKGEGDTFILAWTTTPWTLPTNVGLGFGRDTEYVKIEYRNTKGITEYYILAKAVFERESNKPNFGMLSRLYLSDELMGDNFSTLPKVVDTFLGKDMLHTTYEPLFDFFQEEGAHRFFCLHDDGDYVSTEDGTGIVHFAPSFGAEDAEICAKFDLYGVNPIDENGYFTNETPPLAGLYFRQDAEVSGSENHNANVWVMSELKERELLFKKDQIRHDYPFCWRTDCALMYRGVKTWFVNVSKVKDQLLEQNQNITWKPEHLKDGRFGKLLEGAPDWAISRNRYWGCPLPIWRCDKTGTIECIGSKAELEAKTGTTVDDLHKHFVDDLTWENPETGGTMRRIEEVLDCWFESGSMPYASIHYPHSTNTFTNANFISEGMDQTRGWFYTLHVLGTALFGKNIFDNVVSHGLVVAEDGQKMSKSKKNYPDPQHVFDKYGADSMRFYMLSSPVAKGENLRFSERGVEEVLKTLILPLRSTYQFLSTYANIDNWTPTRIIYMRHGQAEHNVANIYASKTGLEKYALTDLGQEQAQTTAGQLPVPDVMYSSPLLRTRQTADIAKKTTQYRGDILIDDRLQEVDFGDLEGQNVVSIEDRIKNPTTETLDSLRQRTREFMQEVRQKHTGKTVLCVSHRALVRTARVIAHGLETDEEHLEHISPRTADFYTEFMLPEPGNDLDQWILSELHYLINQYRQALDNYDIEFALKPMPAFVDKLNNWYLRRSRARFWAEGLSDDKASGYETLHYVLYSLAKLLAPICPFFAEELYQNLGGLYSVHLDMMPEALEKYHNQELTQKTNTVRDIVGLAASIRAKQNIKLRQPLGKIQFKLADSAGVSLSAEDLDIIKAEANVHEVEALQSLEGIATPILTVNAKALGPKLGKKVQEVIKAAKAGDFTQQSDGTYLIAGEIIEADDAENGFMSEGTTSAEATREVVVVVDTEITETLAIEGVARDLIRTIQDQRKTQGLEVSDRIELVYWSENEAVTQAFEAHKDKIMAETLCTQIHIFTGDLSPSEMMDLDGHKLYLKLDKA